jgi:hypothetical protein
MRTKNLFRIMVAATLFAAVSFSVKAQLTTVHLTTVDESVLNEATDYITVGARVPYQLSGDPSIWQLVGQGALVSSVYNWTIPGGPVRYRINGTTALIGTEVGLKGTEDLTGLGFYNDTIISVDFPDRTWILQRHNYQC